VKDAKGHGSDPRGAHSEGVSSVGRPAVSPKALQIIRENALTGFSVRPDGVVPTKGFQVALQGHTDEQPLDLHNIEAHVAAHVLRNSNVYKDPSMHIGGWNSPYTGRVHLEPSQNVRDRATAERLGRERNQVAVWDNENMHDILTGGTGK